VTHRTSGGAAAPVISSVIQSISLTPSVSIS